ncbi:restriction endonuclease subunit S [Frigoriflavimonas asaccharolytica]|uniref:Type I restriction enzyme S subunit n=1 Tax=Frigoriflavimonas asaccharolytica TaxID=2735899 RepID=A0A8J8GC88_9FLAO|nr:restriction endonuclease subunit S [Frigoriflavimonas asaccharolytica]NRS93569.1 type I restriction enzyme S subunit [Frigoriflavimonas asaccharolytica]
MVTETKMNRSEAESHSTKGNNIEKGMKQTEIGLIPEDWEVENLGKLLIENPNYGINAAAVEYKLGLPTYLRITDIDEDGKFIKKNLSSVNDINSKNYYLEKGDIVFARTGASVGKTYLHIVANGDLVFAGFLIRIKPNIEICKAEYLFYNTQTKVYKDWIISNSMRSGQPGINSNEIKTFQIPLPPLAEQEAIAMALSDCDSWIDSIEEVLAKKRLIKQGAMQELLTPKEDWEVKKLGEVADIVGGGTPSTFISNYWNGHIEWFTPTEVGYDKYLYSSKRKISDLGFKNSSANILPINTILLTSRAGIGDLGILKVEASTNQGFQSIICKETVNVEFIYYLMSTKKEELLKNASGSTFLEISPNKVKSLELSIPSLSEQTRIATILSDMDLEIEALEEKLHKARQIKQGMMQELLTGRVRLV